MPYEIRKKGDKYRLVDKNGRIVKNKDGTPIDGGGKNSKAAVQKQNAAIAASERRRNKR